MGWKPIEMVWKQVHILSFKTGQKKKYSTSLLEFTGMRACSNSDFLFAFKKEKEKKAKKTISYAFVCLTFPFRILLLYPSVFLLGQARKPIPLSGISVLLLPIHFLPFPIHFLLLPFCQKTRLSTFMAQKSPAIHFSALHPLTFFLAPYFFVILSSL